MNVGQVVARINERTKEFEGIKVPVKVIVDKRTKEFEIEVGIPSTAALIKRELKLERGAKTSGSEVVGNLTLDQAIKLAKLKLVGLAGDLRAAVKELLGTCVSMGITVEGRDAREVQREIDEGKLEVKG